MKGWFGRLSLAAVSAVALLMPSLATAPPVAAACLHCDDVRFSWMPGYDDPATPNNLDRVGVLEVGPEQARNVLVLNPGTSAGAGYFLPLARDIVADTGGRWQVWSVERRENQFEDQSKLDAMRRGEI